MEQQEIKMCQKHKLEIVLIDLDKKVVQEERCLCIRCVIEKMNNKKLNLIDETKSLVKEMKMKEQNEKIKENKRRLDNFNMIDQLLRELKLNIDSIFDKIFNNIQSKQNEIQRDLGKVESKSIIINFEEDIQRLCEYQECQIDQYQLKLNEADHKFMESIQKQLSSFINSDQYNKLMNDSIININQTLNQDLSCIEIYNDIQKVQDYKTPALKLICEEHTKEIIMLNLNSNINQQQPKTACIKCVQQYPGQYTHLEDANIQWEQYQNRNLINLDEISIKRNNIQQKILEVIQDIKCQNDQIFNELIQSLINQSKSIEQMNQSQINTKSIYQLTFNQINEVINQLSQIDKFKSSQDLKINIEKGDTIFYSDLRSRFEHFIQYQQINIQRFNQIINVDNQLINETDKLLISIKQKDHDNKEQSNDILLLIEQIRQLIHKSYNFQFQYNLFNETIDQYHNLKENIKNLKLILSNQIEKSKEFQELFNLFNQFTQKFDEDYQKLQQYQEIDQMINNIKLLQDQIHQTINEQDIIKYEQQQQLNQFKDKEIELQNKIQNLQSLNNQNENTLKNKDDEINKLNEIIQQMNKIPQFKTLKILLSSQFQKQLTFSQTHKHSSCVVTQNGKMVENGSYCLCDQVIPKNGVTSFAFKIIHLTDRCFIGIGMREIIQKNNYDGDVTKGYGSYTISSEKYCFSHHEQDKDSKQLSFEYKVNDIIIVEVDIQSKKITWKNANSNQSFTLSIETQNDLYPCLWVNCKEGTGNKVQILQDLN